MDINLTAATDAELLELARNVRAERLSRHEAKCKCELSRFRSGDTVAFHDRIGRRVIGAVLRVNKKTVTVRDENGGRWRVPPTMLEICT